MSQCKARLGVPGAWPCIRHDGHTGAHIEVCGLASFTEYDSTTRTYDARPQSPDGFSAVPHKYMLEHVTDERRKVEAEVVAYIRAQPDGCNPLAIADRIERGVHR